MLCFFSLKHSFVTETQPFLDFQLKIRLSVLTHKYPTGMDYFYNDIIFIDFIRDKPKTARRTKVKK